MSENKANASHVCPKCQVSKESLPSENNNNHKCDDLVMEKCTKWLEEAVAPEVKSETSEEVSEITEDSQSEISDISCQMKIVDGYKIKDLISLNDVKDALAYVKMSNCKNIHIGNVTKIYRPVKIKEIAHVVVQNRGTNEIFTNSTAETIPFTDLNIVKRLDWLAQSPVGEINRLTGPVKLVIISHTASKSAITQPENSHIVRLIQTFHIKSRKWNDIGYNFLIGCDGKVYEGRGWGAVGAHTFGYNTFGIGISFIGCFMSILPNEAAISQAKALIKHGVQIGEIDKDYVLVGHSQCCPTESPGRALFDEIQTWKNWNKDLPLF